MTHGTNPLPANIPLFMARRIALYLAEIDSPVPAPSGEDIIHSRSDGDVVMAEVRWNLPIEDSLVVPICADWAERIGADRQWLASTAEEMAELAAQLWADRAFYVEVYKSLEPRARQAFAALENEGLATKLTSIGLMPVDLYGSQAVGIRIKFQELTESLLLADNWIEVQSTDDLVDDLASIRELQSPRAALAREIAAAGGGVLVDDMVLKALDGLGLSRTDALRTLLKCPFDRKIESLKASNGETIVLFFDKGVVRCTVTTPSGFKWSNVRLSIKGLDLARKPDRGQLLADLVTDPWLDPEQVLDHGYSVNGSTVLRMTPRIWRLDLEAGSVSAW